MLKTFFQIFFGRSLKQLFLDRYKNYGVVRKSLILTLMIILTATTIIGAIWSISLYSQNVALAIIVTILSIGVGAAGFRFGLMYSGVAIKFATKKAIAQTIEKRNSQSNNEQTVVENVEPEQNEDKTLEQQNDQVKVNNATNKISRVLDYVIGILGFVLAIGIVAAWVIIILNAIKN